MIGVAWLLGIGLLRESGTGVSNWLTWHTRLGLHHALLEATVGRLHRMPLSFHSREGVGGDHDETRYREHPRVSINAITQILFTVVPAIIFI